MSLLRALKISIKKYYAVVVFNFNLISRRKKNAVTIVDNISDIGNDIQIPSSPK